MPEQFALARRLGAEALGSFFLFACVIGSGIMAENLSRGNDAIALLGNTLATGAMLFVLITMLGPISGAHMNPAVSLVAASRRELRWGDAAAYIAVQLIFGILGAWAAHRMFDLPTLQLSVKARHGLGQCAGEFIATFGLILTIVGTVRFRRASVPAAVALYTTRELNRPNRRTWLDEFTFSPFELLSDFFVDGSLSVFSGNLPKAVSPSESCATSWGK